MIFFLVLTFGLTDFVSSKVMKPLIERPRPCHEENQPLNARLLIPCGSGYSFTSSHATNHFGIAFFLIFAFRKRNRTFAILLFIWAFLVGYAQIYVGVHFPLDIFCGALLGTGIALLTWELYNVSLKKMAI
jgi:undecaprenyl-diphosphatase